ncbi:hypothetical protein [Shewanella sp.]|uniref:hypothetical protein n=1 Tax=Shewanella sp. TaxID=50422 RepID=UPI004048787F
MNFAQILDFGGDSLRENVEQQEDSFAFLGIFEKLRPTLIFDQRGQAEMRKQSPGA